MKSIPLNAWAARFFDPPPSIHTLRRWCRDGNIFPLPTFVGREWYVLENAVYVPRPKVVRLRKIDVLESGDPIVNSIISGQTAQARQ